MIGGVLRCDAGGGGDGGLAWASGRSEGLVDGVGCGVSGVWWAGRRGEGRAVGSKLNNC